SRHRHAAGIPPAGNRRAFDAAGARRGAGLRAASGRTDGSGKQRYRDRALQEIRLCRRRPAAKANSGRGRLRKPGPHGLAVLATYHGSLSYPSPSPFKLSGKPMPSSGVSKIIKVAVLALLSCPSSFSSITTSATQPFGRHRTNPARPTSWLSSFRPRPEGSRTPKGATTRISLLFWSAVLSTITVRPALERSSATTLWIRAHCSPCAPGGVSQRICQSPWTDRTAPCALAALVIRPNRNAAASSPPSQRPG